MCSLAPIRIFHIIFEEFSTSAIIITTGLVYLQSENCSPEKMRPLILLEFVIGLILFCERTLSRHQIANGCQNLLAFICKDPVFSDCKADPADDDPGYKPGLYIPSYQTCKRFRLIQKAKLVVLLLFFIAITVYITTDILGLFDLQGR